MLRDYMQTQKKTENTGSTSGSPLEPAFADFLPFGAVFFVAPAEPSPASESSQMEEVDPLPSKLPAEPEPLRSKLLTDSEPLRNALVTDSELFRSRLLEEPDPL